MKTAKKTLKPGYKAGKRQTKVSTEKLKAMTTIFDSLQGLNFKFVKKNVGNSIKEIYIDKRINVLEGSNIDYVL